VTSAPGACDSVRAVPARPSGKAAGRTRHVSNVTSSLRDGCSEASFGAPSWPRSFPGFSHTERLAVGDDDDAVVDKPSAARRPWSRWQEMPQSRTANGWRWPATGARRRRLRSGKTTGRRFVERGDPISSQMTSPPQDGLDHLAHRVSAKPGRATRRAQRRRSSGPCTGVDGGVARRPGSGFFRCRAGPRARVLLASPFQAGQVVERGPGTEDAEKSKSSNDF